MHTYNSRLDVSNNTSTARWNIHRTCGKNIFLFCWSCSIYQLFASGMCQLHCRFCLLISHLPHQQITVFTSVLSLDSRRIANDRLDLFCCIRTKKDEEEKETQESLLYLFMKNCYAPFLLHKIVRATVV